MFECFDMTLRVQFSRIRFSTSEREKTAIGQLYVTLCPPPLSRSHSEYTTPVTITSDRNCVSDQKTKGVKPKIMH